MSKCFNSNKPWTPDIFRRSWVYKHTFRLVCCVTDTDQFWRNLWLSNGKAWNSAGWERIYLAKLDSSHTITSFSHCKH